MHWERFSESIFNIVSDPELRSRWVSKELNSEVTTANKFFTTLFKIKRLDLINNDFQEIENYEKYSDKKWYQAIVDFSSV